MVGKVFLVGAGPGNPELITVKGLRLIQSADVILYDRLIARELLHEAPSYGETIDVGKHPNSRESCSQEEINRLLIHHARLGKKVVRLKGGDPLIYGRGSEEALVCFQAGIPFEIVPGISSVNAAPAYAGIPLTHRHLSSSFTVITGHEAPDKSETSIAYEHLVRQNGTIVIVMGVKRINQIVERLLMCGLSPDTPAAVVEQGTNHQQRVFTTQVESLGECMARHNVQAPALIIIGEVVTLREKGVHWYEPTVYAV